MYVDHTGPLTWLQRAWAAVLWGAPAALCLESARRAADGPGRRDHDDGRPIRIMVDHRRVLVAPEGIDVRRCADADGQVMWHTSPPRQRIEEAAIDLAAEAARDVDAVAHLADVVGARLTSAERLGRALTGRNRVRRRGFLESVVADVAAGTCSTLERGYLALVERPHGLPTGQRQFRESRKGPIYRDVCYDELDRIVELDGRLSHTRVRDRDRDLERDLDAAVEERVTARLGWGQVFDRPCSTALKIGALLAHGEWRGRPRRCVLCAG